MLPAIFTTRAACLVETNLHPLSLDLSNPNVDVVITVVAVIKESGDLIITERLPSVNSNCTPDGETPYFNGSCTTLGCCENDCYWSYSNYVYEGTAQAGTGQASGFSCTEITDILNESSIRNDRPNGFVIVEVFYEHKQLLNLPIVSQIIPDPIVVRAYSIMPVSAAEPTPTADPVAEKVRMMKTLKRMWQKIRTLVSRKEELERGQAVVIVAAAGIALIAFIGLVTDVGLVYVQYGHLRRAVDAAAVAAAGQIRAGWIYTDSVTVATQYIQLHNLDPQNVKVAVPPISGGTAEYYHNVCCNPAVNPNPVCLDGFPNPPDYPQVPQDFEDVSMCADPPRKLVQGRCRRQGTAGLYERSRLSRDYLAQFVRG